MHELAAYHGATIEQVEEVRQIKAAQQGGFKEKIYLLEVEDE